MIWEEYQLKKSQPPSQVQQGIEGKSAECKGGSLSFFFADSQDSGRGPSIKIFPESSSTIKSSTLKKEKKKGARVHKTLLEEFLSLGMYRLSVSKSP